MVQGFTWSLYFAQRSSDAMMDGVVSLGQSTLIHDRGGPPVFNTSRPGEVKHFVKYVDNLGVLSANREAVEEKAWLSCPVDSRRIISYPVVAFFFNKCHESNSSDLGCLLVSIWWLRSFLERL